jgi:hypothetical protein
VLLILVVPQVLRSDSITHILKQIIEWKRDKIKHMKTLQGEISMKVPKMKRNFLFVGIIFIIHFSISPGSLAGNCPSLCWCCSDIDATMCYTCQTIVEGSETPSKVKFTICADCKQIYTLLGDQIRVPHDIVGDIGDFREGIADMRVSGGGDDTEALLPAAEPRDLAVALGEPMGRAPTTEELAEPLLAPSTPPARRGGLKDTHTPALTRVPAEDLATSCWMMIFGALDRTCEALYQAAHVPTAPGQRRVTRAEATLRMLTDRIEMRVRGGFNTKTVQEMAVAQLMVLYKQGRGSRTIGSASASGFTTEQQIRTLLKQQFMRLLVKRFRAVCMEWQGMIDINLQQIYINKVIPIRNGEYTWPGGVEINEGDLYNMYKVKVLEEGALGYFATPNRDDAERYASHLPRHNYRVEELRNDSRSRTVIGYVVMAYDEDGHPVRFTDEQMSIPARRRI